MNKKKNAKKRINYLRSFAVHTGSFTNHFIQDLKKLSLLDCKRFLILVFIFITDSFSTDLFSSQYIVIEDCFLTLHTQQREIGF